MVISLLEIVEFVLWENIFCYQLCPNGPIAASYRVQRSYDWTDSISAPKDDGIAIVNIETGEKEILISFEQMAKAWSKMVLM